MNSTSSVPKKKPSEIIVRIGALLHRGESCHYERVEYTSEYSCPSHSHDFFEIFWVKSGAIKHDLNGNERELNIGDLVVIQPSDRHSFRVECGDRCLIVSVAVSCETWATMRHRYGRDNEFWKSERKNYQCSPPDLDEIELATTELVSGRRSMGTIERFLLNLSYIATRPHTDQTNHSMPYWLADACSKISQTRNFEGGAQAFVQLAGRSPEHVSRMAKKLLGKTPTALVNEARMAYAMRELEATHKGIFEIALDCGFQNLSYFYKVFQASTGMTPRHYRSRRQLGIVQFKGDR